MIQSLCQEARDGKTAESSRIRGREVCHCDRRSEVGQSVHHVRRMKRLQVQNYARESTGGRTELGRYDVAGRAPKRVVKPARRRPPVDRSSARESNSDSLAAVATIVAAPA